MMALVFWPHVYSVSIALAAATGPPGVPSKDSLDLHDERAANGWFGLNVQDAISSWNVRYAHSVRILVFSWNSPSLDPSS
jgi:hypothetical protein